MNLPKVIEDLIKAQNNFDSVTYANCFAEAAEMFDEGKTHTGRTAIQHWIAEGNQKYKTVMKPVAYEAGILSAEISGTFEGSPVILQFHFEIEEGFIQSLKITG